MIRMSNPDIQTIVYHILCDCSINIYILSDIVRIIAFIFHDLFRCRILHAEFIHCSFFDLFETHSSLDPALRIIVLVFDLIELTLEYGDPLDRIGDLGLQFQILQASDAGCGDRQRKEEYIAETHMRSSISVPARSVA